MHVDIFSENCTVTPVLGANAIINLINAAVIISGFIYGTVCRKSIPSKIENRIHTLLAAFLCYIALRILWYELTFGIKKFLIGFFVTWGCLVCGAFLFKKSNAPFFIKKLVDDSKRSLTQLSQTRKPKIKQRFQTGLQIGYAFFAITPITFAASFMFGCYLDPRLFIVKFVVDFTSVVVFSRTLKWATLAFIIPTVIVQFFTIGIVNFVILQQPLEQPAGTFCLGLIIAYLALHISLIIIGWNRNGSLFSYVPALILGLILELIF